jgi:hypothetical protein
MTTFVEMSRKTNSEKISLAWVRASQRANNWTLHSGSVWKKTILHFCEGVAYNLASLTRFTSTSLSAGQFYYDVLTKIVYIRLSDSSDPNDKELILTYRLFYSNTPISLPWDLDTGEDVEYEARIESISDFKQELDDEQTGIIQESSSNIALENNDGHFDDIYDVLIFENKFVECFSWFKEIALSEKVKVFKGTITGKSYSSQSVKFNLKDFIYGLRNQITAEVFSTSDGEIKDSILNTPKRRIYGIVNKCQCVGIDNILDAYPLTGTLTAAVGDTTITGSGTSFLDELSPEDELSYTNILGEQVKIKVTSISSNTSFLTSDPLEDVLAAQAVTVKMQRPWRKKNRRWHIAGHKLRAPSTTISAVETRSRFTLTSAEDFFPNDTIQVGSETAVIKKITGNKIILYQFLDTLPSISDVVTKNPIKKAYYKTNELFIDRDWTLTNTTTNAILELTNTADFNITKAVSYPFNCTFTNGSRSITTVVADINFTTDFKTRDWISSTDLTHTTFYEILEVKEKEILIRTAYAGSTVTVNAKKKNIDLIDDDALILVDTMGMEVSGQWKSTASRAVKHLCENDAEITDFNTTTFNDAHEDAFYKLSMVLPEKIGDDAPVIRDVITKINESVFGSLYLDSSFNVAYQVLSPKKPATIEVIKDDDIYNYTIESKSDLYNKVSAEYSPFVDATNGEDSFELYEFESDFVNKLIGIKNTLKIKLYLYDLEDATIIAQRMALLKSLSNANVKIQSNTIFATKNLNDYLQIEFDRLYKRFSNQDRKKICRINSISKGIYGTSIELSDLGNMFNRVMSLTANSDNVFTAAEDSEKIKNGYIVANVSGLPDSNAETYAYSNIIG